jgi:phosphoglycolate phosphatase-like HAD superfamily hydrolase
VQKQLVIFDWDGTLFNSVGQIVASLQFAAQQHQQPLSDDAAKALLAWDYLRSCKPCFLMYPNCILRFWTVMQNTMWHIRKMISGLMGSVTCCMI